LGCTESGIEERCLNTGITLWRGSGAQQPVGFAPTPVFLDENTGRVRDAEGHVFAAGFNPSAAALDGFHLYGPGGTAWDLQAGVPLWQHAPLSAEHLIVFQDHIVSIGLDIRLFDRSGEQLRRIPLPLDPETEGWPLEVHVSDGDVLCVHLEDGPFLLSLGGHRSPPDRPCIAVSESSDFEFGDPHGAGGFTLKTDGRSHHWPLASDGAVVVGDRVWSWTEDGMLCAFEIGPAL
jgi:hypothetical protein